MKSLLTWKMSHMLSLGLVAFALLFGTVALVSNGETALLTSVADAGQAG